MILKNIKDKQKGFTIVELLVVIVVIGILAAITIVSYTGITARAKLASAQQTVNNIVSKAEVYALDGSTLLYPASLSVMTGAAAASTSYYLSGVVFSGTALSAAPTDPDTINFCNSCQYTDNNDNDQKFNNRETFLLIFDIFLESFLIAP